VRLEECVRDDISGIFKRAMAPIWPKKFVLFIEKISKTWIGPPLYKPYFV